MQETHVAYIVDVNLSLEDDNEGFAVHFDGQNGGGEEEFAYHTLAL